MKFFLAIALIVAVASADFTKPTITSEQAEIQEIIAAIASPSTHPATAAALEQMLYELLGVHPDPVSIGPAFIEEDPVSVGPALVEEPVVEAPAPPSAPLVQIILNINQAAAPSPVAPSPVAVLEPAWIDNWPAIDPAVVPEPVWIDNWPTFDTVSPVQVVDAAPVPVEPVIIGTPVLPSPAVVLPEPLN